MVHVPPTGKNTLALDEKRSTAYEITDRLSCTGRRDWGVRVEGITGLNYGNEKKWVDRLPRSELTRARTVDSDGKMVVGENRPWISFDYATSAISTGRC